MKTFCPSGILLVICYTAIAQPQPWMPPADAIIQLKSTGRTTGHIADLSIINESSLEKQYTIPEFTLPSDGIHQGFIIPEQTQIKIRGKSAVTVPLNGYCTDPNLPAPPAGHSLVAIDQWDTGSPLIPITKLIINHTAKLQESGQIVTPFSNNQPREKESVIQQTLWWYSAGPAYNPCDHILRSLSDNFRDTDWFSGNVSELEKLPQPILHDFFAMPTSNPWFSVLKRNIYGEKIYNALSQGIAQFADAISKVGQAAGLADFTKPSLPDEAGRPKDASPSSNPQIFSTIKVVGTGRTTGHIADLSLSNPTKEPINVRIGNGGGFLIPSNGNYQPYIVPSIPVIPVQPGKTVTVPITGYCVDIRRPPVGPDIPLPTLQNWVESIPDFQPEIATAAQVREPINPPHGYTQNTITIPTKMALSIEEARTIIQSIPLPEARKNWNCPELLTDQSTYLPGTDLLMPISINADDMPGLAAPLLLDAINRITHAIDKLDMDGVINTPFSNNKDKERESVIQQTFWMYSAGLSGQAYTKNDFENNTIKQFETTTGKNYGEIPVNQKDQIDKGVDDFWNTFSAVGVEAKILPKPAPPTNDPIRKEIEDAFGGLEKSNIKIHKDQTLPGISTEAVAKGTDIATKSDNNPSPSVVAEEVVHKIQQSASQEQTLPENLELQSNVVEREPMARPANTPCDCKEMTFNLVVKGQNAERNKKRDNRPVSSGQESLTESENEKVLIFDDWSQGDYFTINFNTFKMKCDCQNAGVIKNVECDFFPGKHSIVSDKGRIKIESKPEKIDKTVFEIISENDGAGQKYEYKYTPQKDKPDSFTFCFSAYCKSDKCNEKENEKSCGPYCITLKFTKRE